MIVAIYARKSTGSRLGWLVVLTLFLGPIFGVPLAHGGNETLVDLFDSKGHRTGAALVDQGTGRVDFFDTAGRRTGWGRLDSSGKVERFGLDGTRQGDMVLPVPAPVPPRPSKSKP